MNNHVTSLLNGYFDQQLTSENAHKVESHLEVCPQCRQDLEKIRSLSVLLNQVSLPVPSMSTDQFIHKLEGQLPIRKVSTSERILYLLWMLFPGGLAVCWGFVQVLFITAFIFNLGFVSGLFPSMDTVLTGSSQSFWTVLMNSTLLSEWGDAVSSILQVVNNPVLQSTAIYIVLQGIIGMLFLSWLASWYSSKKRISRQINGL